MNFFGKKPTIKEQMRDNDRMMRRTQRDIEKDRRDLEKQEKKLELDIKNLAKQGNKQGCVILAKQLVQVRKQKARTYTTSSKISSVGAQSKAMGSNVAIAGAMKSTTQAMGAINKQMNPQQVMKMMTEFEKESTKMDMSEEMINDSLDNILDESGDEEEQDAVVQQVLDEIGIEISGKLIAAPAARKEALGEPTTLPTDDELERQLAQLRT